MKEIYIYSGIATGGKELEERQSNISKTKSEKSLKKKKKGGKKLNFFFKQ